MYIRTPLLTAGSNCSCEMTFLYLLRGRFVSNFLSRAGLLKRVKDILNIFLKNRFLDLIINFYNTTFNMLCKRLRVYEWLDQKWLGIRFLFLSKYHKLCFEYSSCKPLSFNNSAISSWACDDRCIAAGQQPGCGQPCKYPAPNFSIARLIVR